MKNIKDYMNHSNIVEGWTGSKADKAYDQMLEVFENMSPKHILDLLWDYLSSTELENIYKWMKQDEYIS